MPRKPRPPKPPVPALTGARLILMLPNTMDGAGNQAAAFLLNSGAPVAAQLPATIEPYVHGVMFRETALQGGLYGRKSPGGEAILARHLAWCADRRVSVWLNTGCAGRRECLGRTELVYRTIEQFDRMMDLVPNPDLLDWWAQFQSLDSGTIHKDPECMRLYPKGGGALDLESLYRRRDDAVITARILKERFPRLRFAFGDTAFAKQDDDDRGADWDWERDYDVLGEGMRQAGTPFEVASLACAFEEADPPGYAKFTEVKAYCEARGWAFQLKPISDSANVSQALFHRDFVGFPVGLAKAGTLPHELCGSSWGRTYPATMQAFVAALQGWVAAGVIAKRPILS